jgi:hypothetical protein
MVGHFDIELTDVQKTDGSQKREPRVQTPADPPEPSL